MDSPSPVNCCKAEPQHLRFDLARTAIVVIDMQNDFCHADGWLASIGVDIAPARTPIAPLAKLLPRPRDLEVTYTPEFTNIVHELRGHIGAMRKSGATINL